MIGIIGYGWVGKATHKTFPNAVIYDKNGSHQDDLSVCEIVFICVPTPYDEDACTLDCSEVQSALSMVPQKALAVIRSTVYPGFSDLMASTDGRRIVVHPEFLGETPAHPMNDYHGLLVIGGDDKDRREVINLYTKAYNANVRIIQVTRKEAEVIKLSSNRAAFFKLMQCQELYDACQAARLDYYTIRDAVYGSDPRHNLWWTFVYPDSRGANSKCIPKDVYAWEDWANKLRINCHATSELLAYNETLLEKNDENR